jgi:hypothetical protein
VLDKAFANTIMAIDSEGSGHIRSASNGAKGAE